MRDISAIEILGSASYIGGLYLRLCLEPSDFNTLEALSVCFCVCIHPIIGTLHK